MIGQNEYGEIAKAPRVDAEEGGLEKVTEEAGIVDIGRLVLAGYIGYIAGKLTSNNNLTYALTGVLSFGGGFIGRGCEFRESEYSTNNVKGLTKDIGTEVSGKVELPFLEVDGTTPYVTKTNGKGKLERIFEVEEAVTKTKTKEVIIRCTEYELKEVRKVEFIVKK